MIPKTIHYCWFGGNPKPPLAEKCLKSWKKYCKDYQIIEWNEDNFSIQDAPLYVRQAYEAKKWAFVSDYVRFDVLYRYGGVYFDTDVEVIRNIKDILNQGPFWGCERDGAAAEDSLSIAGQDPQILIAPGLGMAAAAGMDIYQEILDSYREDSFVLQDGTFNTTPIGTRVTRILISHGLKDTNVIQTVCGVTIYPVEYFCPKSFIDGIVRITDNTYSIHHYDASWFSKEGQADKKKRWKTKQKKARKKKRRAAIKQFVIGVIGEKAYHKLRKDQ